MSNLIIREPGAVDRVFDLEGDEVVIGRSRQSDLRLPNVSVSRKHAKVNPSDDGGFVIEDLGSHNGIFVNGKKVDRRVLVSGDELRIGKYDLIYIGVDVPTDYRDLDIISLPRWHAVTIGTADESTFQVSASLVKRLIQSRKVLQGAVVIPESAPGMEYQPMEREFSIGKGGDIPAAAVFGSSCMAEIAWNGRAHVLKKVALMVAVKVNGVSIGSQALSDGDVFDVGRSRFRYLVRS